MFNKFFKINQLLSLVILDLRELVFWLSILGAKINGISLKHSYLSKKINNNQKKE